MSPTMGPHPPARRARRRGRRRARLALAALIGLLVLAGPASNAWAGRMVATGEDPDVACDARNDAGACHFIRVALDYVRTGAPNPNAPILLFDEGAPLGGFHMRNAIAKAYGGSPPFSIDTQNPSQTDFKTFQINTSLFSAIVVASDYTCGSGITPCGDLNQNTYAQVNSSPTHPWYANDPDPLQQVPFELSPWTNDSDALIAPPGHNAINSFYNAGGGLLVGGGGDNGDGHAEDLYYDFIGVPRGLLFNGDPSSITSGGSAIGFSAGDVSHLSQACPPAPSSTPSIYLDCPYDAFFPLPAGSSLRIAETDATGDPVTMFQDTDPPKTTISGTPPPLVVSRGPTAATFTFSGSENFVSFACQLDSGGYQPCSSPQSYLNLSEGTHAFSVRATDAAGNTEAAPPTTVWLTAFDRDGDGWTRFSNPPDCNDSNAAIHPGAIEPPGGHIDVDCDGVQDPFMKINPHPVYTVEPGATSTLFLGLSVELIPAGSTVEVSCASVRRCPFRRTRVVAHGRSGRVDLKRIVKGRHMPVGSRMIIRVTRPQEIGAYVTLLMRRNSAPRKTTQCMNPGGRTPQPICPKYS